MNSDNRFNPPQSFSEQGNGAQQGPPQAQAPQAQPYPQSQQQFAQQPVQPNGYPQAQPNGYAFQQAPSGPPMNGGTVPSHEPPKKNWVARHKFLTAVGAVIGLFVIIGAVSGGGDDNDSPTPTGAASTDTASSENADSKDDTAKSDEKATDETASAKPEKEAEPAKEEPKEEPKEPEGFKIGDVANAGDMTYKVTSVKKETEVGSSFLTETAKGTYLVVEVEVTNNSDDSVFVDASFFTLMNGDKKFEADSTASMYANTNEDGTNSSFFLEDLNPDLSLSGVVVFDVSDKVAKAKDNVLRAQTGFWGTETVDITLAK